MIKFPDLIVGLKKKWPSGNNDSSYEDEMWPAPHDSPIENSFPGPNYIFPQSFLTSKKCFQEIYITVVHQSNFASKPNKQLYFGLYLFA